MVSPQSLVFILIGASIALILPFLVRPTLTVSREGKIFAFIAFLVFPVLAASIGASEHFESQNKRSLPLLSHYGAVGKEPVCGRSVLYSSGALSKPPHPSRCDLLYLPQRLRDVRHSSHQAAGAASRLRELSWYADESDSPLSIILTTMRSACIAILALDLSKAARYTSP